MSKKETADIINNLSDLTIGNVFQLIRKIKFTALLSIFAMFSSILGGAYALGRNSYQKDTAVMLHSPFSMRLKLDDRNLDFQNLTLIKDPSLVPISNDTIVLSLREIKSDFDVMPLGVIVAKMDKAELSWPWSLFVLVDKRVAHAAIKNTTFDFGNHKGDFNYHEKFINKYTVRRFYDDGCILEYKVDGDRRSIRSSFVWIRNVHDE